MHDVFWKFQITKKANALTCAVTVCGGLTFPFNPSWVVWPPVLASCENLGLCYSTSLNRSSPHENLPKLSAPLPQCWLLTLYISDLATVSWVSCGSCTHVPGRSGAMGVFNQSGGRISLEGGACTWLIDRCVWGVGEHAVCGRVWVSAKCRSWSCASAGLSQDKWCQQPSHGSLLL